MKKTAIISDCTQYRYELTRIWDETKPLIGFIMLNPSTADDEDEDNTIDRCIAFGKSWGYGGIIVGNLFAYRDKNPKNLLTVTDAIGPDNQLHLINIHEKSEKVICAWGSEWIINRIRKKNPDFQPFNDLFDTKLHFLELSVTGTPKHPLYLKGSLIPIKY